MNKINGIDVSECCFYNNGKCDNPNGMACNCINNAVCYFKQLKRLQEENEKLKTYIQKMDKPEIKTIDSEIALKNIELQKENEKLKEDLKGETEQAQKWYQLETDKHFLALKFCKTLEEIRDYCEKCKQCVETGDEIILYTVIKKIDEVLNDRD